MKQVIAYADEFGNNSFDFSEQGSHFIVASVIINRDEMDTVRDGLENIRKKYFQTGEIKSNRVSGNHRRRLIILEKLQKFKFSVYAVIVDKRKLYSEGFQYKKSFYKFLNGLLYKELYRTFPQLDLIVDEHGSNDFMRSFKKYVKDNHIRTLFEGSEFNLKKSQNDLGVQLADFIAGTLGYIYDENKKSEESDSFLLALKDKLTSLNFFPREITVKALSDSKNYSQYDKTIAELSFTRILDQLDTLKGDSIKTEIELTF